MGPFFKIVQLEYEKARSKYPPFHSTHEGIAVIQEEVDELWDYVKNNKGITIRDGDPRMVKECIQIAAMVYAFVKDLDGMEDLKSFQNQFTKKQKAERAGIMIKKG